MSKWTVFAYAPDLYGHVDYGIQKDNFMSGQVWRNKETAELMAAAWNGDDKLLAAISEIHIAEKQQAAEMRALLAEFAEQPYETHQRRLMERAWDLLGIEYTRWSDDEVENG